MPLGRIAGRAAVILVLSTLVVAIAATGGRLERPGHANADLSPPPVYLPDTRFLQIVSLGYQNVLADLLWFRTISYFGEHYRSDRTYPWLAHMCDRVTDLDPRAWHVYRFAGMVLPWEAGQADEGLRLLEKGTRVFPDSWLLHFWLGFEYYLFKDDYEAATRHLERATRLPDCDPYVTHLLALFHDHQYGPQTTVEFLTRLAASAESDEVRQAIEQRRDEARLAADLERLDGAIALYRERFQHPPASLQDLVTAGLLATISLPPFGGRYQIDAATGQTVTSTGHKPRRVYRSKIGQDLLRSGQPADQKQP
jgi:tetratricopeptide (TPR) repeat protein